jgi:hypothetical protein
MLFRCCFVLIAVFFSSLSCAGEFRVHCFTDLSDCASKVSDIVTDKFTNRYPVARYKIVVLSEFLPYSDGGGVGFAVAGVSPLLKDGAGQIPSRRYTSTIRIVDRSMSAFDVTKKTEELLRSAVEQLMAACERSVNCDVYKSSN